MSSSDPVSALPPPVWPAHLDVAARAQARCEQGLALHQKGRLAEAREIYRQVLELQPGHFDALHLSGLIAYQTGSALQAVELIGRAIDRNPENAAAYGNRGLALQELQRLDEALDSYDRALMLKPDYAEGLYNRGNALLELKRLAEALASYDRALELRPDYAKVHNNRGHALQELKRLDEALAGYDRALELKPDYADAHSNRGVALQELHRLAEALESYHRALEFKPDYADAHWNLAHCHLLMGDFARGWQEYEWRWQNKQLEKHIGKKRDFEQPLWLGAELLHGKTILLHSEQGLGDTLQFCRYAKPVSDLGARVILEVPRPLLALLKNLAGVAQLVEEGGALPAFDCHCPLMSLPLAFKTDLNTIPSADGYIASSPERVNEWRKKLGDRTTPRVGLAWSGSPNYPADAKRSIALGELVKHLPGQYQYFSLQKEVRSADRETLDSHTNILHFGADFADTAALCELMDVVVSVDTSIAALAGAMGKPVWILLSFMPHWTWLLDREDSAWYRSARLFRQDRIGDWAGVLDKLQIALLQQFRGQT